VGANKRVRLVPTLAGVRGRQRIRRALLDLKKPFIASAPDAEETAHPWVSGELLTHYHDWRVEFFTEEVFDCLSGRVPHQHAVNRMIARKEPS
jgi:hypothetical protein